MLIHRVIWWRPRYMYKIPIPKSRASLPSVAVTKSRSVCIFTK